MGPVEIIYVVHEASCVGYFAHLLVLVVEDFKGELVVVWDEVLPTGVTFARTGSPPFHSLNNDLQAGHRCRLARVGVNGNGISVPGGISSGSHGGPGADSPVLPEVFSPELGGASPSDVTLATYSKAPLFAVRGAIVTFKVETRRGKETKLTRHDGQLPWCCRAPRCYKSSQMLNIK